MIFQYVACSEKGDIVKGRLTAANEEAVTDMLSFAGYRLINLKPFVPFLSSDKLTASFFPIKQTDIILFYRQLALLLESGINIINSIELLRNQAANRVVKKVLGDVVTDLRGGNQLSAAMAKHPEVFSTIACRSLSIGEQTGGLETMLRQMADYMEKEAIARKSIKGALTYPIIAAIVALVVVGVLVGFVLPQFSDLYSSMGAELPALTRILIDTSDNLRSNGLYILIGLFVAVGLVFAYVRTPTGRYNWDKLMLNLPLLGRVNLLGELSRACRSIALLFRAGLPLTEIIPLVIQGSGNKVMALALNNVHRDMLKGEGLSQPMANSGIFLPMMVQMVKVGEETGNLDTTLMAVATSYETEAEDSTRSLIAMIQPTMVIVIALIVGVIALSLVSAMYSVYGQTF